jgi:tRNA(Ile)-lysidine synthase
MRSISMPDFPLLETCEALGVSHSGPYRLGVALSGGMDSVVLLHYLVNECRFYPDVYTLSAYHVHHGLNPAADQWAHFCVSYAESLGVSCEVYRLNALEQGRQGGQSLEQWAREARYASGRHRIFRAPSV